MQEQVLRILWYLIGAFFGLLFYQRFGANLWNTGLDLATNVVNLLIFGIAYLVILLFFVLVDFGLRAMPNVFAARSQPELTGPAGFPGSATLLVAAWIVPSSLFSILALLIALVQPDWLVRAIGDTNRASVLDAIIVMSAAAVGANIATILGYLRHASEEKNFDLAFVPWYFARPLLGALLGLVFFLLLRGGLLMVTVGTNSPTSATDLSDLGLAGIGGLVGMFSKNAVEKLREVFGLIFSTQKDQEAKLREDQQNFVKQLPEEIQQQARQALGLHDEPLLKDLKNTLLLSRNALRQIAALPDEVRQKVRQFFKTTALAEAMVDSLTETQYTELLTTLNISDPLDEWRNKLPAELRALVGEEA